MDKWKKSRLYLSPKLNLQKNFFEIIKNNKPKIHCSCLKESSQQIDKKKKSNNQKKKKKKKIHIYSKSIARRQSYHSAIYCSRRDSKRNCFRIESRSMFIQYVIGLSTHYFAGRESFTKDCQIGNAITLPPFQLPLVVQNFRIEDGVKPHHPFHERRGMTYSQVPYWEAGVTRGDTRDTCHVHVRASTEASTAG